MLTTKKTITKMFYDFSKITYKNCGRKLSKYDEYRLKNEIDKFVKNYTLWNKIKQKFTNGKTK